MGGSRDAGEWMATERRPVSGGIDFHLLAVAIDGATGDADGAR